MAKAPESNVQLDIKALLSVALEQQPRDDVSERVMNRVALMDTLMEFARLIATAPLQGLVSHQHSDEDEDDEHEHDDEHGDPSR